MSRASAHEPKLLDARRATPGLRLEMTPTEESRIASEVNYRLRAYGFPKGTKLLAWAKEFDHTVHQLASIFQVDQAGNIVEDKSINKATPRKLEALTFGPGPYPRGAHWEVALVSVDRKLQAYAKAIPYPISARDGTCEIALELVSHRGEKFLVSGSGFLPADQIVTELQYAGRITQKRASVLADGHLQNHVILHAGVSEDRSARYVVKAKSCTIVVAYEWGDRALARH